MTFAETMVARMDELGMRAVDLAEKSGVTAQYLSKLMVGRVKEPTWSKARAIIDALDMTPEEFAAMQDGTYSCPE